VRVPVGASRISKFERGSQTVLEAGDDGHGRLLLQQRAIGVRSARFGPALVGALVDASSQRAGSYAGWIAGTGSASTSPSRTPSIPSLGTASIPESLGDVLPPAATGSTQASLPVWRPQRRSYPRAHRSSHADQITSGG